MDCHAALWHTLARRAEARRRTLAETVRSYCAMWDARTDSKRARWVRNLPAVEVADGVGSGDIDSGDNAAAGGAHDDACLVGLERPVGWPPTASWPRHLPLWRAIYARAGAFLRGAVRNPCDGRPWHTGATYGVDKRRAERAGWVRLECGDTGRQAFYGMGRR